MSQYFGDYALAATVYISFNTSDATGAPITLAGTPSVTVYKDNGTTQVATGASLTVDFDSVVGLHLVTIDMSADGTFYSSGSEFSVALAAGTVGGISVVGQVLGAWSVQHRSALRPTTAGRTLDVASTGEAGLDFDNVKAASAPTTLTNITVPAVTTVGSVTTKTGYILASTGLDSISTTAPTGVASNFREMLVQTWRRFFKRSTRSTTQIITLADDGTTPITTQPISDDEAGNEVQGAAV